MPCGVGSKVNYITPVHAPGRHQVLALFNSCQHVWVWVFPWTGIVYQAALGKHVCLL